MKASLFRTASLSVLLLIMLFLILSYLLGFHFWQQTQSITLWNHPQMHKLQVGDIILRSTYDKESRLIEWISDGNYSHIAVITDLKPEIIVTHATTNENGVSLNQVQSTSISYFLSPTITKRYQIVRPHFLSSNDQIQFAKLLKMQLGKPYILKSRENENLYCTTLLEQALKKLYSLPELPWQRLSIPGYQGDYLFPDAFLTLPNLETIIKKE